MASFSDIAYRCATYVRHYLRSTNTLGHGIHSPHLYELVRMVIYDDNSYYCYSAIERQRQKLLLNHTTLFVDDMGSGKSGKRRLSDIVSRSAETPQVAQTLMRIVNHVKAHTIVELGTCVGLTTAYLASPSSRSRVFSFEGSHELLQIAKLQWQQLGLRNIETIEGNIDHTLPPFVDTLAAAGTPLDFAFLDANHTFDATKAYFDTLLPLCRRHTIIAVDDIYYSPSMNKAWQYIRNSKAVTATIDCYHFGLVFFDPQYEKRIYRIRI